MRVSLLLQREPFGEILEKTLAGYFEEQHGTSYNVNWREGTHSQSQGRQAWLCNPYLNIFFRPDCRKEPLQPAIYEFSRSIRPWCTPLNKAYVALATGRLSSRFFANAVLNIDPPLKHAEEMVIIGGNHHLRLLDYHHGHCTVISKHGFDRNLMLNDIAVRRESPSLPTPRLIDFSASGSWYREELILGTPINRLKNQNRAMEAIAEVMPALFALYESIRREEDAEQYLNHIISHINQLIERNHLISQLQGDSLRNAVGKLSLIAGRRSCTIPTVQAHGDFQPANILVGEGGPWLIDWEYTMRRQVDYDALVLALSSRRSDGFSQRFQEALKGRLSSTLMPKEWPVLECADRTEREQVLSLFLLEELELRLRENDNVVFKFLDSGFHGFLEELETIVPMFDRCEP